MMIIAHSTQRCNRDSIETEQLQRRGITSFLDSQNYNTHDGKLQRIFFFKWIGGVVVPFEK